MLSPVSSVLRPRLRLLVAANVPEPVVVIPRRTPQSSVEDPAEKLIVAMPEVLLFAEIVIGLDDDPVQVAAADIVVVDPDGSCRIDPDAREMDAKVFALNILMPPPDVFDDTVRAPNVRPPPLTWRSLEVFPLIVSPQVVTDVGSRFVVVPISKTAVALVVVKVNVPLPSRYLRAPVPDRLTPFPVNVMLIVEPVKSSVPVKAPAVSDRSERLFTVLSTVTSPPPDDPSNVTESPVVGAVAPLAPPDVAAQCVVDVLSHVPAPPTQKREAISYTLLLKPIRVQVTVDAAADPSMQTAVFALKPSGTGRLQTTPDVLAGTGNVAFTEPAAPSRRSTVTAVADVFAMMTDVM